MRLYHRTSAGVARAILAHGFRDAWGYYLTDRLWYGVWLSDVPLDEYEGTERGDCLLVVDLGVPEAELAQYAWVDPGKPCKRFLLPAELINRRGVIHLDARP
jgi:hypothetical protein